MVDLSLVKPNHLWYIVGLIATDGSLSKDLRHVVLVSKDEKLLIDVRESLYVKNTIGKKSRGGDRQKKIYSVLQIGDKKFFNYLLSLGLMPNKSLILGAVTVPNAYFIDFLRGVIDGDGNIANWTHHTNKNEQWALRITSGSKRFVEWLKNETEQKFSVRGKIYGYKNMGRQNFIYHIKFGKLAAKVILKKCYYKNCLALSRKFRQAHKCIESENKLSKYGNVIRAGMLERQTTAT